MYSGLTFFTVSVMCFLEKLCWYICDVKFVIVDLCFNGGKSLIISAVLLHVHVC